MIRIFTTILFLNGCVGYIPLHDQFGIHVSDCKQIDNIKEIEQLKTDKELINDIFEAENLL